MTIGRPGRGSKRVSILIVVSLVVLAMAVSTFGLKKLDDTPAPHVVSFKDTPDYYHWMVLISAGGNCGGVVVKEGWVLTAAHCVRAAANTNLAKVWVYPGKSSKELWVYGKTNVTLHPECKKPCENHDLALIEIESVKLDSTISAIRLASEKDEDDVINLSKPVHAAGWRCGSGPLCNTLVHQEVWVKSFNDCIAGELHVCMESFVEPHDSGNPLSTTVDDSAILLGIAHRIDTHDIYSRVSQHLCWIKKTIGDPVPIECKKS